MPLYGNLLRGQIPYATSPNDVSGDVAFTYSSTTQTVSVPNLTVTTAATLPALAAGSYAANSVASGDIDAAVIQVASVAVSSTEIKALFSSGKTLVAGVTNKIHEFLSALLIYNHGSTVYTLTSATNALVSYTDINGAAVSVAFAVAGFLDQSSDKYKLIQGVTTNVTPVLSAPLVLTIGGADPTLGNGTMLVKVAYRTHAIS